MNLISHQPDFSEVQGNVQSLFGTYNRVRTSAVVNLPVTSTFALRFAATGDRHDGYIANSWLEGPQDDLRDENVLVGRLSARWRPLRELDMTFRYTRYDRDVKVDSLYGYTQIGCYQNNLDATTSTGMSANSTFRAGHCFRPGPDSAASTGPTGASTQVDYGPYNISRDGPSRAFARGDSFNLQVNYNLGPASLAVVAAHDKYKSVQYYDPDYSNGFHYGQFGQDSLNNFFAGYDNNQKSDSLEVRLASNGETALKWLVGAYTFKQRANWDFGFLAGGRFTRYGSTADTFDSESQALFGNASLEIMKDVRLLGGLRYNKDRSSSAAPTAAAAARRCGAPGPSTTTPRTSSCMPRRLPGIASAVSTVPSWLPRVRRRSMARRR